MNVLKLIDGGDEMRMVSTDSCERRTVIPFFILNVLVSVLVILGCLKGLGNRSKGTVLR